MNDKIHLTVSDFEPANSFNFELCIEIGENYYSYAILDEASKTVKAISSSSNHIFDDIDGSLLQTSFSRTKINILTKKYTFIPTVLFQRDNLKVYSKYLQAKDHEQIFISSVLNEEITAVYAFDKLLLNQIEKHFPSAKLYPQFTSLLKGIDNGFSFLKENQFFANFRSNNLEITIYIKGEFVFYNIFEFENDEEVLYFLLLATQENNLEASTTELKISGNLSSENQILPRFKEHFGKVNFINQDSLPLTSSGIKSEIVPRFFSLLSLHLCE